jgi:hypothetical protein
VSARDRRERARVRRQSSGRNPQPLIWAGSRGWRRSAADAAPGQRQASRVIQDRLPQVPQSESSQSVTRAPVSAGGAPLSLPVVTAGLAAVRGTSLAVSPGRIAGTAAYFHRPSTTSLSVRRSFLSWRSAARFWSGSNSLSKPRDSTSTARVKRVPPGTS